MPNYDVDNIRQIPIMRVCALLRMKLRKTGHQTWNMVSEENERDLSSLTIFEKTNTFVRFSGKGDTKSKGDVIALVEHINGIGFKDAIEFLAINFPSYQ